MLGFAIGDTLALYFREIQLGGCMPGPYGIFYRRRPRVLRKKKPLFRFQCDLKRNDND